MLKAAKWANRKQARCYACARRMSLTKFIWAKHSNGFFYPHRCLECARVAHKKKYWGNPEKHRKAARAWQIEHRDKVRANKRKSWAERKARIFDHYGRACACCGEKQFLFLSIDHKEDGGNEHRRQIGWGALYTWLEHNHYPKGFQTLCMNCNFGKRMNKGVCPHEAGFDPL